MIIKRRGYAKVGGKMVAVGGAVGGGRAKTEKPDAATAPPWWVEHCTGCDHHEIDQRDGAHPEMRWCAWHEFSRNLTMMKPKDCPMRGPESLRRPRPPQQLSVFGPSPKDNFRAGFAWIWPRVAGLLAAGWTRRELFGRSPTRWPTGPWGVAWLSAWSDPATVASLGADGEIVFEKKRPNGRFVRQTVQPRAREQRNG